ncbi:Penicillin-binding protein [Pseudomonas tremae]|uniref:Peptidoglycan D,D-transpeptidase MrdA n=6 Tax=Pseudomonas syringae group TaxID=136849 RepID=A0AB37QMF9_9PSED|nr:Penicillin-binding protein [Pseudomonas coronafaciens pv. garcae]KPY03684.1 Penicillin-binding protein [Pseudomonas coronafaciens pv. oryzae]KPZ00424.1 Penicillin-binding protein [Pseudomonas tremae]KPZ26380.1 Penicillin-binding protein [Pseudomonas coronafaciens pv. zizaniae]RMM85542.1 Penicillin-binding protein [Pseudomonas coronafaciens pv. striafaciens]RMP33944.1 Penicillin-binding protein [Pseudomonas coronafaciens pv. atropurpurea]RMS09678.1 Penicillin-binding protein [Pseudomonas co
MSAQLPVISRFLLWCAPKYSFTRSVAPFALHREAVEMPNPIPLKDHEKETRLVNQRLIACAVLVGLLATCLVARMYFLQVTEFEYHSTISENNRVHVLPIPPERGLIFDRNGEVLADNRPSFNLTLTRERAGDWHKVIDELMTLLELPDEDRILFDKELKQVRHPFEPATLLYELTEEQIATLAVNQYLLPGVDVAAQFVRHYPLGAHFAHSIGYVGRINEKEAAHLDNEYRGTQSIGKTGIERFYESELHGHVGYEEVETNAQGRVLRVLKHTDPVPGKNITLTLDAHLQAAAEDALGDRRGSVVALDPETGEVLAMVSKPSFDPNLFVTGISFKQYAALRDSIDRPLFNRVLRGLYAPGSTVKPEVAIAGLDSGVVTASTKVFDPGYFQLPDFDHKYRNWNHSGDGWVDMDTAIMRSNDTYFYTLAHKLGIDRLHDYMTMFGIGQKVSLDMFEEAAGLMPSREWKRATRRQAWFPGETVILGIGQGYMQVTPLQLAQATSLIASKGVWHRPHLAMEVGNAAPVDEHPMPNIVLHDPNEWNQVNTGMQMVMHDPRGIARDAAKGAQYRIAGKSGTAQVVAIKQGERYNRLKTLERNRDNALFVGFAPADHPKIVVSVTIENGEAGGRVAGPVVREILDAWLLDSDGKLKPQYAVPTKATGNPHA